MQWVEVVTSQDRLGCAISSSARSGFQTARPLQELQVVWLFHNEIK